MLHFNIYLQNTQSMKSISWLVFSFDYSLNRALLEYFMQHWAIDCLLIYWSVARVFITFAIQQWKIFVYITIFKIHHPVTNSWFVFKLYINIFLEIKVTKLKKHPLFRKTFITELHITNYNKFHVILISTRG